MRYLLVASLLVASLCGSSSPKNYVEIPHAKDCKTYFYLVHCGQ